MLLGLTVAFAEASRPVPPMGRSLEPDKPLAQLVHRNWRVEDGLPQHSVNAIVQTSDGYLWVATLGGLVRFDGVDLKTVSVMPTAVGDFGSHRLTALAIGPSGTLWIGTEEGQLAAYRDGEFRLAAQVSGGPINSIGFDDGARPVVATWRGIYRLTEIGLVDLLDRAGTHIQSNREGLWITGPQGFFRIAGGQSTQVSADGGQVSVQGEDGGIYLGSRLGLERIDSSGSRRVLSPQLGIDSIVTALAVDRAGTLWAGTVEGTLLRLRGTHLDRLPLGRPGDPVKAIFEDRDGSLWVGTQESGLHQLLEGPVTTIGRGLGLDHQIGSVLERTDGSVWLGGDCGEMWRFSGERLKRLEGFGVDCYRDIHEDKEGNLWVAGTSGLTRIDPQGRRARVSIAQVNRVLSDSNGGLWLGTLEGQLHYLEAGSLVAEKTLEVPGRSRINHLSIGPLGSLWIGTAGGLGRLDGEGRLRWFDSRDGLHHPNVRDIYHESENTFLIALYGGGLSRFSDGVFTPITPAEGLCGNFLSRILRDDFGRFWVNSNAGLFYIEPSGLDALTRGAASSRICTLVRSAGGGAIEGRPGGARASDGRLWFPNLEGVSIVDPEALDHQARPPVAFIDGVVAANSRYENRGEVRLQRSPKRMEIHYGAVALRNPERLRFQFRLVGHDDQWVSAGLRRTAYFTNLEPGSYRFELRASTGTAPASLSAAAIAIVMPAQFHQTLWFRAGFWVSFSFLSCLLVFTVQRQRSRGNRLKQVVATRDSQIRVQTEQLQEELSRRRAAQAALERSRETYRDLIENISELVYTHDSQGTILTANRSLVLTLGYQDEAAVVGRNLGEFLSPEEQHLFGGYLEQVLREGNAEGLMAIARRDGRREILEFSTTLRQVRESGVVIRGVSRVVTERIEAEKEIRRLNKALTLELDCRTQELDETQHELQQARKMEAIGRLAGGVAHDFNNLLSVITGIGVLMNRQLSPQKTVSRYAKELEVVARRGKDLTSQLLAMSRRQVLKPTVFDLNDLVRDLSPILRRLLREDIELRQELGSHCPIRADLGQIEQVIINLAANAREALPRGGTLFIKTERLEAGGHPQPGTVRLTVRDDGVGIAPEVADRLFEPFYTTRAETGGTGLGLAIVHGIIAQSGGRIKVRSELGAGAAFQIDLPLVLADDPPHLSEPSGDVSRDSLDGAGETVLVVEDEEGVRRVLAGMLGEAGYRVVAPQTPAEAIQAFQEDQSSIDIVLSDVIMPGMRGPDLVRHLRALRSDLKVVYMTGYAEDEFSELEKETVITKPIEPEALLRCLRSSLG